MKHRILVEIDILKDETWYSPQFTHWFFDRWRNLRLIKGNVQETDYKYFCKTLEACDMVIQVHKKSQSLVRGKKKIKYLKR